MTAEEPEFQCVLIAWGDKYGPRDINRIVEGVRRNSRVPVRFVLISDRPRDGLDPAVQIVDYPTWWLAPEFRKGGCQAKLAMFESGVLPDDLPALFLDLDTAILGDMSRLTSLMRQPRDIWMLQSVVLPFGWPGRLVYRLTGGRRYARGNSSIVLFHPAHCTEIAARFRALYEENGGLGIRPMIADERFISWVAQMRVNAIPRDVAVKFPTEFMHVWRWMVRVKSALPWVRARRARLAAVTLPGLAVKPEALVTLSEGDQIQDGKKRWLIWERKILGTTGERLQAYFAD